MDYSFISNAHPTYIENMYTKYKENPEGIADGWREFFQGFEFALNNNVAAEGSSSAPASFSNKEFAVHNLINGYRQRGHLMSTTNPIRTRKFRFPSLDLPYFGLSKDDLDTKFAVGSELGMPNATLREIRARLQFIYCRNIGFEFQNIENRDKYDWLRARIEAVQTTDYGLPIEKKHRILKKLNGAIGFENFLAKKYVAQKRFGLEGGESTIPALDAIINKASQLEVGEVVIGMAHRGRLNVLANIMKKTYEYIFEEFEGEMPKDMAFGDGDVKYHLGFSSEVTTPAGYNVHLKMVPNPSHLEAVGPVVQGFARAKADLLYHSDFDRILPILIHGDAAVAGQGVVHEVVQMSQLEGYYTGGTIHFVINNQIGFTTDFDDARSSTYCTGVAALVQAPVFHVNADDPEAVVFVSELAAEYRQEFNTDVFIDMVGYRKHGHNEGDDPKFTQPQLYKFIKNHKDTRTIYSEKLIESGTIGAELAQKMDKEFDQLLQARFNNAKENTLKYTYQKSELAWQKLQKNTSSKDYLVSPDTSIPREQVDQILGNLQNLQNLPEGFKILPKFKRILKRSQGFIDKNQADWSMAEHLAYGSLLLDGQDIRMSGQDVKRGTFSHRNAVLYDVETNEQFNRLNHLGEEQGQLRIYNSLLSEFAVLGFEYGYSITTPDALVIWEAQFGDFANGAQTMIDQFITSSESKWHKMTGLVMLLPHGYEGQGPEHSSARLERYLQACAEFNMTVANVTTPANFFHLIRRQQARPFRKPLVVMSPKKLLRFNRCVSDLNDFTTGGFHEVYDDPMLPTEADGKKTKRVLCCSGKIYYDLLERKEADGRDDVAIIRLEQLYPFPKKQVNALIHKYPNANWFWVQEEPSNMGAWQYILAFYRKLDLELISRKSSASPATGYKKVHDREQQDIVDRAFAPIESNGKVVSNPSTTQKA
ncbi:MAG: 2-oxoglutarate dehydrogenase E1 component [Aureispira sp.]|nr:2-oxoglutarate dehydrogenase E1 component [Aureispira sp.]